MFRPKAILMFLACTAAMLGACGRSPTAPVSAPPAAVQPAMQTASTSAVAGQSQHGRAATNSEGRGRSKYSVIYF